MRERKFTRRAARDAGRAIGVGVFAGGAPRAAAVEDIDGARVAGAARPAVIREGGRGAPLAHEIAAAAAGRGGKRVVGAPGGARRAQRVGQLGARRGDVK